MHGCPFPQNNAIVLLCGKYLYTSPFDAIPSIPPLNRSFKLVPCKYCYIMSKPVCISILLPIVYCCLKEVTVHEKQISSSCREPRHTCKQGTSCMEWVTTTKPMQLVPGHNISPLAWCQLVSQMEYSSFELLYCIKVQAHPRMQLYRSSHNIALSCTYRYSKSWWSHGHAIPLICIQSLPCKYELTQCHNLLNHMVYILIA